MGPGGPRRFGFVRARSRTSRPTRPQRSLSTELSRSRVSSTEGPGSLRSTLGSSLHLLPSALRSFGHGIGVRAPDSSTFFLQVTSAPSPLLPSLRPRVYVRPGLATDVRGGDTVGPGGTETGFGRTGGREGVGSVGVSTTGLSPHGVDDAPKQPPRSHPQLSSDGPRRIILKLICRGRS